MENSQRYNRKPVLIRIAAAFAAAAVMLLALPAEAGTITASAQSSTIIYDGDFGYTIDVNNGKFTAIINEFRPEDTTAETYDVQIPDTISSVKYPVTGIAAAAFSNSAYRTRIKSVKIPKSVTEIGDNAFRDCTTLETADISGDLKTLGSYAFAGCTLLGKIKLPDTLTEVGYSAFYKCTSLTEVTFPKSLTYIGQSAFSNCTSLKKAEIPDSVKNIGSSAFDGCTQLETLKLSKELKTIDDYTFHNCTSLQSVTLPDGLEKIGTSAFAECLLLSSVNIPETVGSIGAMAFSGCPRLTAVIIPQNLENISDSAFYNSNAEIWGYSNSYAETYAYRNGLRFHSNGAVRRVTFSADSYYATVNNIAIRSSKGVLVIPPSSVTTGELLTISATAPEGYDINYILVNNAAFANGSTYAVTDYDVDIFVSYKPRELTTTTSATVTEVTTTTLTTTATSATTLATSTSVSNVTSAISSTPSDDETTEPVTGDSDDDTNSFVKVDSDLEDTNGNKVRVITQRDNFIAPVTVRVTNTAEAYDAAKDATEALDTDNAMYYAFDISLYGEDGKENQGLMARGTITFQVPVPTELLPYADTIKVYHIVDGTPEPIPCSIIEDIAGVKKVQFETDSFSPYMFVAITDEEVIPVIDDDTTQPSDNTDDNGGNAGVINQLPTDGDGGNGSDAQLIDDGTKTNTSTSRPSYNGNINPHTGAIIAGSAVCGITLVCIPLVRSRKKRKRAKSSVN